MYFFKPVFALLLTCSLAAAVTGPQSLSQVRRIYVARMPNNLDQYVRTEIYKQFKDKVAVVLDRREADGILLEPGTPGGRAFPLPAMNTAESRPTNEIMVSLLDRSGKLVLWSDDLGQRDQMIKRGGAHTVAEHLVHRLKHAIESSK